MSEETKTTQAEVHDAAVTNPTADGADAGVKGDDLDTLLSQYDESTGKTEPKSTPEQKPGAAQMTPDAIKRLETLEKTLADDRFQKEIAPVIKDVRGDIPADVMTDEEIQDWMEGRAKRDPRLAQAWIDRPKNPQAWGKVQEGLRKELSKKFSKLPDANATEDHAAVAEAVVRGASKQAPESKAPDYSRMSPAEYREDVYKRFGYYPPV